MFDRVCTHSIAPYSMRGVHSAKLLYSKWDLVYHLFNFYISSQTRERNKIEIDDKMWSVSISDWLLSLLVAIMVSWLSFTHLFSCISLLYLQNKMMWSSINPNKLSRCRSAKSVHQWVAISRITSVSMSGMMATALVGSRQVSCLEVTFKKLKLNENNDSTAAPVMHFAQVCHSRSESFQLGSEYAKSCIWQRSSYSFCWFPAFWQQQQQQQQLLLITCQSLPSHKEVLLTTNKETKTCSIMPSRSQQQWGLITAKLGTRMGSLSDLLPYFLNYFVFLLILSQWRRARNACLSKH